MKLKKVLMPFMAGALALGLAACGDKEKAAPDETKQEVPGKQKESAEEMQAKLAEQQVDKNKVVALVNGEELTGEDYNAALTSVQGQLQQMGQDPTSKEGAEQVKAQTLDTLVNQTLILQKAKEADIKASASEIDEEYSSIEKQFGNEKEMKKVLESQGVDAKTLKEQIADSILFEKYIEKVAPAGKVATKEIKEYYDQVASTSKEAGQELPPLEEVEKEIEGVIKQQQQQKLMMAHIEELKAAADIELKL
ncbi:SurA N-terminal domain-containing protein [Sporosarcina sp. ACRSM]|uniref:SurA N-terminal domain-containing protein n=1 Tax=Sporosarcina sp. ACRSM TaxID=2918216 RepID=UPI001EF5AF65|nr:SurA N-terminal domain-containing protein [Sporosarcina sp. ACRSM]MCG7337025.1 SurA N-terminal domain-containing protein [Sporosarcina sp. ACRSM]